MKRSTISIACLIMAAVLQAQQQTPPRDAAVTPTSGTATIAGTVVDDEAQPRPVRRAIVTLSGAGLVPNRGAITDDDGHFSLMNLPAGRFTLTVMRASFITSAYGAKRPGRPGTAIAIGDGEHVTGIMVRMWRGAAIGGSVRDESGKPLPNLSVTATPARASAATGLLTLSNNGAMTDDRGEFRLFGLEPGTYVISVTPSTGAGAPLVAPSEADIDAILAAAQRRSSVSPSASQPPAASIPATTAKPFDYAPVYFPGTVSLADARRITLAAGQEMTGVDFSLQRVLTTVVEGTVTRPDGSPAAGANIQITPVTAGGLFASDAPRSITATSGPDGTFRVRQLTPGDYAIVAKAPLTPPPPAAPGGQAGPTFVSPGNSAPSLWAQADISVAGNDLSSISLRLEPGATIVGKVVFEGASAPPSNPGSVQLWLRPPGLPTRPGAPINTPAYRQPVFSRADGTFEIGNILPGPYQLTATINGAENSGWWARSAMMGERDLLDGQTLITRDAAGSALIVTFSDRHTELSGALQTAGGAPVSDVFVIAYAADRKLWGIAARRVRAVRPDADGRYSIKDLPPGDYLISAVTDVDQDEWQDPAFLEKLLGASVKITIADGEKKVQDLRLGGLSG
jgi:hypothetical protein